MVTSDKPRMIGTPILPTGPAPMPVRPGEPGHGWSLSEETRRAIREIEINSRMALAMASRIRLG